MTEAEYNAEEAFYKRQIADTDRLLKDDHTPKIVKKGLKIAKVLSEGVFDFIAVSWGATQGSKILKSGAIKFANSKFFKSGKDVGKYATSAFEKLGGNTLIKKLNPYIEKLSESKYGQYLATGMKALGQVLKKVAKIAGKPFEGKTSGEIYDKTSNVVAKTLGVGSGVAGIYGSARKEYLQKIAEDVETEHNGGEHIDLEDEVA
jgi:hypothetical protein